jgi:hypothetical protein
MEIRSPAAAKRFQVRDGAAGRDLDLCGSCEDKVARLISGEDLEVPP